MYERIISNQVINEIKKRTVLSEQSTGSKNDLGSIESVKLYKLSNSTIKILNERLKDEYYAHYLYRAAANWCHDQNYKKAAAFFDADANTELVHAGIIQKYMTDFNILPEMSKPEPNHNFDNLIDIIQTAYEFELKLMKSYNENSHSVFQDDLTTFDFLQQFRDIQRESVVEFNDLINGSNLVNKKDKFQVLYFENTYF
jgi:ferritin